MADNNNLDIVKYFTFVFQKDLTNEEKDKYCNYIKKMLILFVDGIKYLENLNSCSNLISINIHFIYISPDNFGKKNISEIKHYLIRVGIPLRTILIQNNISCPN